MVLYGNKEQKWWFRETATPRDLRESRVNTSVTKTIPLVTDLNVLLVSVSLASHRHFFISLVRCEPGCRHPLSSYPQIWVTIHITRNVSFLNPFVLYTQHLVIANFRHALETRVSFQRFSQFTKRNDNLSIRFLRKFLKIKQPRTLLLNWKFPLNLLSLSKNEVKFDFNILNLCRLVFFLKGELIRSKN